MTWLDRDGVRLGYEELGTGDPPMVLVLGLERPVVVGHSLGGIVALALATVDTRRVHPRTLPCRPVGLGARIFGFDSAEVVAACRMPFRYVDAGTPNVDLEELRRLCPTLVPGGPSAPDTSTSSRFPIRSMP